MAEQTPNPEQDPAPEDSAESSSAPDEVSAAADESGAQDATPESADHAEDAEAAIASAQKAVDDIAREAGVDPQDGKPVTLQDFSGNGNAPAGVGGGAGREQLGLPLLHDVNLSVKIELGRTRMYVEDVLRLNTDSVIELDKAAGDPVDVYVNDRHVARGEVLVVNDNFCVRISEIVEEVEHATR